MQLRGLTRLLVGFVLWSSFSAAFGCQRKPSRPGNKSGESSVITPKPAAGLTPEQATLVLARVGDKPITLGDYAAALERMDRFERLRYQSPERKKQLLDEIIAVELLADEARRRGLDHEMDTQLRLDQALRDEALRELRASAPTPNRYPSLRCATTMMRTGANFSEPERRRVARS